MRVFISSVITAFEEYRSAARKAVELLGHTPVMAEEFGARPETPQEACLQGVQNSDAYILALGPRYGSAVSSGISPTEEEFEEAVRLRLPIMAFKATMPMDAPQEAFAGRVSPRWEDGSMYARFTTPEDLKDGVIQALSRYGQVLASRGEAPGEIGEWLNHLSSEREDVGLSIAFAPSPRIAIVELQRIDDFGSLVGGLVEQSGLVSAGEVHARERSVEVSAATTREQPFGIVEIWDDMRSGIGIGLRNEEVGFGSMSFCFIDRNKLRATLAASIALTETVIRSADTRGVVRSGWFQCKLWGIRNKEIADLPDEPIDSFTMPTDIGNEVTFPSEPLSVAFKDMNEPDGLAETLLCTLERQISDARRRRY